MLPLIKDFVKNTELAYFIDYFLPLASKVQQRSNECLASEQLKEHKIFDALQNQVDKQTAAAKLFAL